MNKYLRLSKQALAAALAACIFYNTASVLFLFSGKIELTNIYVLQHFSHLKHLSSEGLKWFVCLFQCLSFSQLLGGQLVVELWTFSAVGGGGGKQLVRVQAGWLCMY